MKNKIGYTTGTCAQAAAKAACLMLINRKKISKVNVTTPTRKTFNLKLYNQEIKDNYASCCVLKKSPDEYDVTDKAKICARVQFSKTPSILIKGGKGVGIVNKPGLAICVGEYAINPVPRKMIIKEIEEIMRNVECGMQNKKNNSEFRNPNSAFKNGFEVTISVPDGEKLAKHTFNPQLGIIGGISIIGTTGIVEPKSTKAYQASLALQLNVLKAQGYKKAILVLGYVGERYCRMQIANCRLKNDKSTISNLQSAIKIGDHVGFMLKQCEQKKIEEVLLIGHIGKLIKVANGQFNTNIKFGDNRINLIARYAKLAKASKEIIKEILKQISAEATIDILRENNLMGIFDDITQDVVLKAAKLTNKKVKASCIVLSLNAEALGSYPKNIG